MHCKQLHYVTNTWSFSMHEPLTIFAIIVIYVSNILLLFKWMQLISYSNLPAIQVKYLLKYHAIIAELENLFTES